jgi:hypothetical protein
MAKWDRIGAKKEEVDLSPTANLVKETIGEAVVLS